MAEGRIYGIRDEVFSSAAFRSSGAFTAFNETRGVEFPDDPYVWDVAKIHAAAGKLWVFTSVTKPNGDDNQVDVFDAEGRYIDSIILRYPAGDRNHRGVAGWTLLTADGFFFVPE